MAKYYFEGAEIVTPFSIYSNEPFYSTNTISLRVQRASSGHQRWELSFQTLLDNTTQVDGLLAAILNVDTARTMVMPQLPEVMNRFSFTGTNLPVAVTTGIGVSTVSVDSTSVSGLLPKGMFIKFNNHDKIYIVTADCDLSGTGAVDLNIFPKLRTEVTTSNTVELDDDVILNYFKSDSDQQGITFLDGVLSDTGSINIIEAL